jgi:hypothetical protein
MDLTGSRQDSLDGRSARCKAATYIGQQTHRTNASMPRGGFEHTISVFERTKTFHAIYSTSTVIGILLFVLLNSLNVFGSNLRMYVCMYA